MRIPLTVALACALTTPAMAGTARSGPRDPRRGDGGVPPGVDLDTVTIPELQLRMADGSLPPSALTAAYLHRIRTLDHEVNAVITIDPSAEQQAAACDVRHRTGSARGPMDGIPVLLKDNIDTGGMATTAGSLALAGEAPARDAALVTRLRDAGAVILGKTNLSEWANFRSPHSTSGWSAVGGQTNNPHVLDRNPCGSSSGSAAGIAASMAQVAIGTETEGSIVGPAGMTGIVGHKPSLGLVSGEGVVPISSEQDTPGPMARNVTDTAIALSVLRGPEAGADHAARLRPDALRGSRVGLWRQRALGPEVDALMSRAADVLRAAGAGVVEVTLPYQLRITELEFPSLLSEFRRDIDAYLATRRGAPQDLAALVEFNRRRPEERACFEGQELFEYALDAPPTTDAEYRAGRAELTDLARRSVDETMAAHGLDAIASPANPPAWTTDCARGDEYGSASSVPAAVSGCPSTVIPAGFVGELPVGVLFMAGYRQDGKLLSLAAAAEGALKARRAPRYLPTLP